jgi:hypothetical protein
VKTAWSLLFRQGIDPVTLAAGWADPACQPNLAADQTQGLSRLIQRTTKM